MREKRYHEASNTSPYTLYLVASIIFGAALFAVLSVYMPHSLVGLRAFLAITVMAFRLMGFDKRIAGTGATRVPELVLWGVAGCGGSLGMFLGMQAFRHKTKKAQFQIVLLLLFVAQLAIAKHVANSLGITKLQEIFATSSDYSDE